MTLICLLHLFLMPLLAGEEKNDEAKTLQDLKKEVELYRQKLQELEERLQQAEAKLQAKCATSSYRRAESGTG